MADVGMPRLSDSMEEGTILKWLKTSGTEVARGEELVEIETDKATMTYEADEAGVLEIVAAEGDTVPIGAIIARIGDGTDVTPEQSNGGAAAETKAPDASQDEPDGDEEKQEPQAAEPTPTPVRKEGASEGRVKASPLARRLAREQGVDISALEGTGMGGRIVRADVEAAASSAGSPTAVTSEGSPAAAATQAVPAEGGAAKGSVTIKELSRIQKLIARRMAESKATIPEFAISTEVDMEACVDFRAQLKGMETNGAPSYNDMVIKACALALREFPQANGSYQDGRFETYGRVNVGMAVAAEGALVVPTVFDADSSSLGEIARTTRTLAGRVRSGEITPPELSGGTFTVSNLGMYGITEFTAVINPPQAAILAVGAMAPTPVARDGQVVIRNVMSVTLTADHRILYGADAAQFLARIRELLETPITLLL